ncbi:VOC family protein [Rudaeicoccus suwonensis]|uniref:Putative enzyme related to lactoylglutathione lyase n=1 Tax=Rudaeicoccus suwonensis TaxID=657409 RepID=A0A561E423_9MICO|nr:VOC family protein [Rudaeicoccus suwonensis]TWE10367.1 putative enzyme related to lactoylglutathione lyase [Rudaeicoccus suwonensis]
MTATTGPDFVSFQVRNVKTSARFYEETIGLTRLPAPNPAAAVFSAGGVAFAVREPLPGVDLDAISQLGAGVGVWFHNEDATGLHARLTELGVAIVAEPTEGPFGVQFSFRDPDGYVVTVHSKA